MSYPQLLCRVRRRQPDRHPGLVLMMLLADSSGLCDLVDEYVTVARSADANAEVKVGALAARMVAGTGSISDMDLIRHGGMGRVYTGRRVPTTVGTHLRGYTFGHLTSVKLVRNADAVDRVQGGGEILG